MRTNVSILTIIVFLVGTLAWADRALPSSHADSSITAIDAKSRTVTARETKTGRTFQFTVADTRLLNSLKVGHAVRADFKTMKVSVRPDAEEPCCAIVNVRPAATAPVR